MLGIVPFHRNLIKEKKKIVEKWRKYIEIEGNKKKKKGRNKLTKISRSLSLSNLIDRLLSMPCEKQGKGKKKNVFRECVNQNNIN